MPLDAAIRQLFVPYHPSRRHSHQFWHKKMTCCIVGWLSEAGVQKAQNGSFTQLIEATSCVERLNAMIRA
jgi:hypothetical protein